MKEISKLNLKVLGIIILLTLILGVLNHINKTVPSSLTMGITLPITLIIGMITIIIQLLHIKLVKVKQSGGKISWEKIAPKKREFIAIFLIKLAIDFILIRAELEVIKLNRVIGWLLIPVIIFIYIYTYKYLIEKMLGKKIKVAISSYFFISITVMIIFVLQTLYIGFEKMNYVTPIAIDYIYMITYKVSNCFLISYFIIRHFKTEKINITSK
jgi:hypothetical protein